MSPDTLPPFAIDAVDSKHPNTNQPSEQGVAPASAFLAASDDHEIQAPQPAASSPVVIFSVGIAAFVCSLDVIRLPSADQPATVKGKKSLGVSPNTPKFTMIVASDHIRFRLHRHETKVETNLSVPGPLHVGGREFAVTFEDLALFHLFAKAQLGYLEHMSRQSRTPGQPSAIFKLEPARALLTVSIGPARYELKASAVAPPVPLQLSCEAGKSGSGSSSQALARALRIAATFSLLETPSERKAASRLNVISCSAGTVRGGTASGFTSIASSLLDGFDFSIHRRDSKDLAFLLQRSNECTYDDAEDCIRFQDAHRIIEVSRAPLDFMDATETMATFAALRGDMQIPATDFEDAALMQSIIHEKDSDRHPAMVTIGFDEVDENTILLRGRAPNGRNHALTSVKIQTRYGSAFPANISVVLRCLLRAVGTAERSGCVSLKALKNCVCITISGENQSIHHFLVGESDPTLSAIACPGEPA